MNQTSTFNKLLLFFCFSVFSFTSNVQFLQAQSQYNDGNIRLRVWLHKVWTNSDCEDIGDQEYVYRNIRVRPRNDISGAGWSPNGLNVRADGEENRWWSRTQWNGLQKPAPISNFPMTEDGNGVLMMDITYPAEAAPTQFDWSIGEMFENDQDVSGICGFFCDDGNPWIYEGSFCCGLLGDDAHIGYVEGLSANPFRSGPEGEVHYVQTDIAEDNFLTNTDQYAALFAFQWDWVNELPDLCPAPKYSDGSSDMDLEVRLLGVWSDSDYDQGFECFLGLGFDEDLRVRYRSKDNLGGYGAWECINNTLGMSAFDQSAPEWNVISPYTLLSENYPDGTINHESFELDFELWEEDSWSFIVQCGTECTYDSGACFGTASDEAHFLGSTGPLNWRDSPPNTWNRLDIPLRADASTYNNWTVWIDYRWGIGNPQITGDNGNYDVTICNGESVTLDLDTENITYYQWQYTETTGSDGGEPFFFCPTDATWIDLEGEVCEDLTISCVDSNIGAGTRIYRLKGMNRNGMGSTSPVGERLDSIFSFCYRVTCLPYEPPIQSAVCGQSAVGGNPYNFSVLTTPTIGALANANYSWSVSPSAGVTPSTGFGSSFTTTFPEGIQSYTITLTTTGQCQTMTSTCTVNTTLDYCGHIYVSPSGNNSDYGGPDSPLQTLGAALNMASTSGGSRTYIKMLEGSYTENTILNLANDITIEGGYQINGDGEWVKNSAGNSTINMSGTETISSTIAHNIGFKAHNVSNWTLQSLNIHVTGPAGVTSSGRGKSVYGVAIHNASG